MIEMFPDIVTQLAGIADRFATALDCVDTGFLGDGILDELPDGSTLGASRVGGVDLNKKRMGTRCRPCSPSPRPRTASPSATSPPRSTPSPAPPAPPTASARRPTICANCAANSSSTSPHAPAAIPPLAARTIAALLALRDQVIAPILAAVRSPRLGRKPAHWTRVDRDYERIRIDMQTLFTDLAIETPLAA